MDHEEVERIMAGDFAALPELPAKRVCIYLCSSYTGMDLEKGVLMTEVIPRLRHFCRDHFGLEFQVMDWAECSHTRLL